MVSREDATKVTKVIQAFMAKGWILNMDAMTGGFGDATRIYLDNGESTLCFKVYMDYSKPNHPDLRFQIISFNGITDETLMPPDNKGHVDYDQVLDG